VLRNLKLAMLRMEKRASWTLLKLGAGAGVAAAIFLAGIWAIEPASSSRASAAYTARIAAARNEVRENSKDGLKYVHISAGNFMMGCSPGDDECQPDERPPHRVSITRDFWIGQTEVTVGAYKRYAAGTGHEVPGAPSFNPNWASENMPMTSVTWDEARDFCAWLGGRLPTEAEWEYAARGGSTQARYGPLAEIAAEAPYGSPPRVVGMKRPNGFGLFDVLGNASEWVNDWYDESYYQHSPSADPQGPKGDGSRVLRGGPLTNTPWIVRVSYRDRKDPGGRDPYDSFRCVWGGAGR
jgi:formylglycine-generating enzyme required for sulfatase activity